MAIEKPSTRRFLFRNRGELGYLAEVSLIIFSILFAFWVERWREGREEQARLSQYITEIKVDLADEKKTTEMNLYDCLNDCKILDKLLEMSANQVDSTEEYRNHFLSVFYRGVFRTFAPTTVDVMTNNGDLELIKDSDLQKSLVSTFAFRKKVEEEFGHFNDATAHAANVLFGDLKLVSKDTTAPNPAQLYKASNTAAVFTLRKRADYKAFILENYLEDLDSTSKKLNVYLSEN